MQLVAPGAGRAPPWMELPQVPAPRFHASCPPSRPGPTANGTDVGPSQPFHVSGLAKQACVAHLTDGVFGIPLLNRAGLDSIRGASCANLLSTSTWRSLETISSGLYLFVGI